MKWNRRQFLAVGALGTAGLAIENKARRLTVPEKPWNARTERSLQKFRDPVATACAGCPTHCSLVAYRGGDRVVQVLPNPKAEVANAVCPRAYQSLEALYDPERVLRPLVKTGKRGEGKWSEISWDEALGQLAEKIQNGPEKVVLDLGRPDPVAGPVLQRLGVTRLVEHHASREWAGREAQRGVYGAPLSRPDLSGVRTLLLVGARPLDGGPAYPALARDLVEAKARGTRIVSIGSYEGATGSLADEWIPTAPGTEVLVLLSLARVILSQEWFDREAFGRVVGTPGEKVRQSLLAYALDRVQKPTDVTALRLLQVARRFAGEGPSLCLVNGAGTGSQSSTGEPTLVAQALEAAAAVLNALRGDPEAVGLRLDHRPEWLPSTASTLPRTRATKDILAGSEPASLYLAYRSNPVYWSPRSEFVNRGFADESRVELLVAMDTHLTETAQIADLVLPAATDLEMWNLFGGYAPDGKPYAVLQQPAARRPPESVLLRSPDAVTEDLFDGQKPGPLGEARQLGDVLLDILGALDPSARENFPHLDSGSYVRHLADTTPALAAAGGFQILVQNGVWLGPKATYPWAAVNGYPTLSGLVEVSGKLVDRRPASLTNLRPLDEDKEPGKEYKDAFALILLNHPELGDGYANSRWGREIRHQNPLYMNARMAREMGLREGDPVTVSSDTGEVVAHVRPIEGIHPQSVALAEDFGHWAGGVAATARGDLTGGQPRPLLVARKQFLSNPLGAARQATRPAEIPWWHPHGPGVSVQALSPFASDEHGAQAWREIRVTIHPV
jgi:anaerobic selenocysteine-containing dehydrogenase